MECLLAECGYTCPQPQLTLARMCPFQFPFTPVSWCRALRPCSFLSKGYCFCCEGQQRDWAVRNKQTGAQYQHWPVGGEGNVRTLDIIVFDLLCVSLHSDFTLFL